MPLEWVDSPPTNFASDLSDYYYLEQIPRALQERFDLVGSQAYPTHDWPSGSTPYDAGILTDAYENSDETWTLVDESLSSSDAAKGWDLDSKPFTSPDDDYAPTTYSVVIFIDEEDPRKIVRANITANTTDTLTIAAQPYWINLQKIISGVGDLVGKRYLIVDQRWVGSWAERYPEVPVREFDFGAVVSSTASVDTTITDTTKHWTPDYWTVAQPDLAGSPNDFDLIVMDTDGVWQRSLITGNTATTITVDDVFDIDPGAEYFIVPSTGDQNWWIPERRSTYSKFVWVDGTITQRTYTSRPWLPYEWYRGILASKINHSPQDTLTGWNVAEDRITRTVGDVIGLCDDEDVDALDNDIRNGDIDVCSGEARRVFAPHLYKTLRGWQLGAEQCLGSALWVERKDYEGATAIPTLNKVTWMKLFLPSTNYRVATITGVDGSGNAQISITMPEETPQAGNYAQLFCIWAMIEANGDVVRVSEIPTDNTVTSSLLTASAYSFEDGDPDPDTDDIGKQVIIVFGDRDSAGWSAWHPRRFQYLYPAVYLSPDDDVWPPTEDSPGEFISRPASSQFVEADEWGVMSDVRNFVAGESAIYLGTAPPEFTDEASNALQQYEDRAWVGRPGYLTGRFVPAEQGVSTGGGNWYLTDDDVDFWEANGTLHSGTASHDGTTTTLRDTTKSTSNFFDGIHRDFVGFVINFTSAVDGSHQENVGQFRRITNFNSGSQTFTFSPALPHNVQTGDGWEIQEPGYVHNWWKDHRVTVTFDGVDHVETCIGNNRHNLFFSDLGYTIPAGATYVIENPEVGTVWQRRAHDNAINGWVRPADAIADARSDGDYPWHVAQNENAPTSVRKFRRLRYGDYPLRDAVVPSELYGSINKMVWTRHNVEWTAQGETNTLLAFREAGGCQHGTYWSDSKSGCDDAWATKTADLATYGTSENFAPYKGAILDRFGEVFNTYLLNRYAYSQVTTFARAIKRKIQTWIRTGLIDGLAEPGTGDPEEAGVSCRDESTNLSYAFNGYGEVSFSRGYSAASTVTTTTATIITTKIGDDTFSKPTHADGTSEYRGQCDGLPECPIIGDLTGCVCDFSVPVSDTLYSSLGWKTLASTAIAKWNIEDGLRFTDTDDS